MDFILELIVEIVLEGGLECAKNKKIPMFLRVLILILFLAFYAGIILLLLVVGFNEVKRNVWAGCFLIIVDILIALSFVRMIRKIWHEKKK